MTPFRVMTIVYIIKWENVTLTKKGWGWNDLKNSWVRMENFYNSGIGSVLTRKASKLLSSIISSIRVEILEFRLKIRQEWLIGWFKIFWLKIEGLNSNFNRSRSKSTVIPNGSMDHRLWSMSTVIKGLEMTAPTAGNGLPFIKLDGLWKWTVLNKKVFGQFESKLNDLVKYFGDHFWRKLWKQLIHVHDHLVKIQIGNILK